MDMRHTHRTSRSFALIFLGAISVALFSIIFSVRPAAATAPHIDVMVLNTDIGPASLQYLTSSISTAEQDGAQALVMEIDTPGGDITSMKAMVEAELSKYRPNYCLCLANGRICCICWSVRCPCRPDCGDGPYHPYRCLQPNQ